MSIFKTIEAGLRKAVAESTWEGNHLVTSVQYAKLFANLGNVGVPVTVCCTLRATGEEIHDPFDHGLDDVCKVEVFGLKQSDFE